MPHACQIAFEQADRVRRAIALAYRAFDAANAIERERHLRAAWDLVRDVGAE